MSVKFPVKMKATAATLRPRIWDEGQQFPELSDGRKRSLPQGQLCFPNRGLYDHTIQQMQAMWVFYREHQCLGGRVLGMWPWSKTKCEQSLNGGFIHKRASSVLAPWCLLRRELGERGWDRTKAERLRFLGRGSSRHLLAYRFQQITGQNLDGISPKWPLK